MSIYIEEWRKEEKERQRDKERWFHLKFIYCSDSRSDVNPSSNAIWLLRRWSVVSCGSPPSPSILVKLFEAKNNWRKVGTWRLFIEESSLPWRSSERREGRFWRVRPFSSLILLAIMIRKNYYHSLSLSLSLFLSLLHERFSVSSIGCAIPSVLVIWLLAKLATWRYCNCKKVNTK